MEFTFGLLLGFIAGIIGAALRLTNKSSHVGTLHVITSVYEEPYLYLDLNEDPGSLVGLNQVVLDVKSRHVNSQH